MLEDAGIKAASVASRRPGKSGREMIEALIAGERNPRRLADLARGLRRKADDLQMACDGRFAGGHGQMCRLHAQSPYRWWRAVIYACGQHRADVDSDLAAEVHASPFTSPRPSCPPARRR